MNRESATAPVSTDELALMEEMKAKVNETLDANVIGGVTLLDVDGVEINAEGEIEPTGEFLAAQREVKEQMMVFQVFGMTNRRERRAGKLRVPCLIGKTKLTSTKVNRNALCECGCGLKSKRCTNKLPASNT
jgi:hypothetical protein